MLYIPNKCIFIHIPRTSGMSLCKTFMKNVDNIHNLSPVINLDTNRFNIWWRHSTSNNLKQEIKEWNDTSFKKFAFVRNPFRICESFYKKYTEYENTEYKTFEEYILLGCKFLLGGGFVNYWANSDVELIKYVDIDNNWETICEYIHIPKESKRELYNDSRNLNLEWTDKMKEFIFKHCEKDLDLC